MTLTFEELKLFEIHPEELHEMSAAKLDRLLLLAAADHKAKSKALKKAGERAVASFELLTELEYEAGRRSATNQGNFTIDDDPDEPLGILRFTAKVDDVW